MAEKSDQMYKVVEECELQNFLLSSDSDKSKMLSYVNKLCDIVDEFKVKAHLLEAEQECLLATLTSIQSIDIVKT